MSNPFDGIADAPFVVALQAQPTRPENALDALIEAVLARLKQQLPERVSVERFPDRPETYDFPGFEAAVLVSLQNSSFERGGSIGAAALKETLRLAVTLLVRSLNGAHGAPALLEDIRLALQGASLAGATALQPVERGLEAQSEGVWQFGTTFETRLPALVANHHPSMQRAS